MSTPWELINENILNVSLMLNDLIDTTVEKDVSWTYKENDGTVTTITIPNTAKLLSTMNNILLTYINDNTVSTEDTTAIVDDAIANMNISLDTTTTDLTKLVDDSIITINNNLSTTTDSLTTMVNDSTVTVDTNLTTMTNDLTDLLNTDIDILNSNITAMSDTNDTLVSDFITVIDTDLTTVNDNISTTSYNISTMVTNNEITINDKIDTMTEDMTSLVDSTLDTINNLTVTINKPTITAPVNDATDYTDTITSDIFSSVDSFSGIQDYVEWQLSTDIDFNTTVDSYIGSDNLASWAPDYGDNSESIMYVRVRYGSDNHVSVWSDVISFITADIYIETPVITSPTPDSEALSPVFTYSTFNVINGDDTLVSVDFELSTTSDFSTILYSYPNDTTNLTSFTLPDTLDVDSTYYVRVRYNGETYVSAYGTYSFITRSKTEAPVLSGDTSGYEKSDISITIDNYDSTFAYIIAVTNGDIVRTDSNIVWTLPTVDEDTTLTLSITAEDTVNELPVSTILNYSITDKNIPIVDDQTLVFDDVNIDSTFNTLYGTMISDNVVTSTDYNITNIIDTNNTSTTTEIYVDLTLVNINIGDRLISDTGEIFTVNTITDTGLITPTLELTDAPTTVQLLEHKAISDTIIQDDEDGNWVGINGNVVTENSEDIIDTNNTSTTTEIYINNKLVDMNVGDRMVSDTGETFTVSIVNNDGTTATIDAKVVACGDYYTAVIKDDNSVWSVGRNSYGQLGDGTTDNRSNFVDSGISAIAIACGYAHTAIIKDDNSVWSVGRNDYGQLGDGTTDNRSIFVNTDITAIVIACGIYHTAIIKDDNSVWSVGYNVSGQLGDGTTDDRSTFVNTDITATSIVCGLYHTAIIKDDNSVWSVGNNDYGQLGDGTTDDSSTFVDSGISAIVIACGYAHTAIIKDDNTVWSVGYNYHGQLGDGTTDNRNTFVNSGISAIAIACGYNHTVAIKDDNTVWAVGDNNNGQLGDGTTTDRYNFVDSGISAIDISCGVYHTTILKDDNTVWTIGDNSYGQLGDGTTTDSTSWIDTGMTAIDVPHGLYYPNYWIIPTLELNTVPTNVYPISKYFINDTEFIPNGITYDTGVLNYTMDDVVFDPTIRDIKFTINLIKPNTFTYFSGMLAKED